MPMDDEDRYILNLTCEHIRPLLRTMIASGAGGLKLNGSARCPQVSVDRGLTPSLARQEASRRGFKLFENTDPHYNGVSLTCRSCGHSIEWYEEEATLDELVTTFVEGDVN
jgi:hypothetical protein